MGSVCCGSSKSGGEDGSNGDYVLSPEEVAERREKRAEAAEKRAKDFKQGGGGEKLKAKAKALEEAEKKNQLNGPNKLQWSVS